MTGGTAARIAHLANIAILVTLWMFALRVYDALPGTIPIHFGADGAPNAWASKSLGVWLLVPISALVMTGLLYLSSLLMALARERPNVVNLPRRLRDRFVKLTPERREPVIAIMRAMVFWIPVPMNALLLWIMFGIHRSVVARAWIGSPGAPMAVFFASFAVLIAVFLVWTFRAIDRA